MDEGERPLVNIIIYWLWTINHTLLRHYDLQMTSAILSFAVAFSPPGVAILRKTSNQNTSKTRRSKIRRARDSTTCIFAPRVARRRNSSRALILLRDSVCKVVHLFFFLWFVPVCYAVLKKWHLKKKSITSARRIVQNGAHFHRTDIDDYGTCHSSVKFCIYLLCLISLPPYLDFIR